MIQLNYLSLLQIQRDLYETPPGPSRFREYLAAITDAQTGDLKLPLDGMNPMAKAHLPQYLDTLLAFDADNLGIEALTQTEPELKAFFRTLQTDKRSEFQVCLVVADDLGGGWTNRYTAEYAARFEQQTAYKRGWIVATLWASETPTPDSVRQTVRAAIFRAAYILRYGEARTLDEMMKQEAYALQRAGVTAPRLDVEDLEYTRSVLSAYRRHSDRPTLVAALFGDPAARELGYRPLGLTAWAGLALALDKTTG